MCRFSAVAALLLLSVAPLCAADDSPAVPWYKRIFSKPEPKPEPVAEKPPTWKDVSRSLDQERAVYMERLQFCTKLRQIAAETNDEELTHKADALEQQAETVYIKRTKTLPAVVQDVKSAEASLEQRHNTPATGTASSSRVVTGRSPNGRPTVSRE